MSTKLILVVKSDSILARGVMSILEREDDLITLEVQPDYDGMLSIGLDQPAPDVIFLEAGLNIPLPTLHSQITHRFPQTPVIVINTPEDCVQLSSDPNIFINEPLDLVSTIRNLQHQKVNT